MDVSFYDFDFNHLATFPRCKSINFEIKYCGFGTAEVHFSLAENEVMKLLEDNTYMFFTVGEFSAIVTGFRISEEIEVFGRTPEWLLTKRGLSVFERSGETAEILARRAVTSAAGDFITMGSINVQGKVRSYKTEKVRVLYDVVLEILGSDDLGFRVRPDFTLNKFVFEVFEGSESVVMISLSNRNAYDMIYTVEKQDMVANAGWYERKMVDMGVWDAYNNSPSLSDNDVNNAYTFYKIISDTYYVQNGVSYPVKQFGFTCTNGSYIYSASATGKWKITTQKPDTVWVYVDNDLAEGAKKWEAVLSGTKTESEAIEEIKRLTATQKAETEIKSLEYGKDYKLGDIVRVQFEFGDFKKTQQKRVSSVNIYFDVDKAGITPVFSNVEE